MKTIGMSVDILVIRNNKLLLGLMNEQWNYEGQQVYGVPGRDIRFREKMGATVKRNIKEEIDCMVTSYDIMCVNANYALGNHYIGIGITAQIEGEPKVLRADDWVKWVWFDRDDIPNNLFPPAKNLIECYFQNKVNISE